VTYERVADGPTFRFGFLSRLFLNPKPDGSSFRIFNLRRLKELLPPKMFYLVDRLTVIAFFQRGDVMVNRDP